jgi:hypothetical protein
MENDDVHFGHVQAHQRHRGAEADRQTHRRYLNLTAAHAEKSKINFNKKIHAARAWMKPQHKPRWCLPSRNRWAERPAR